MAHKLLLTWNIRPGHEREHFQDIRRFVTKISALGLDLADAWYTVYGSAPHILLGIVPQEAADKGLENVLSSEEWNQLVGELSQYIVDYEQRIVRAVGSFQF